jgi:hypothetical protein
MYPHNDNQYEESTVKSVRKESDGWSITRSDGWSFYVPAGSPVEPKEGMTARFYGKGLGYTVRGLYIDGRAVFYRSEEADKEHHDINTYGKDAQDWLNRWDEGRSVWSISMGGLGPGYEQALQITTVEIVRFMLKKKYDAATWQHEETWKDVRKEIDQEMFKHIDKLGLSGMQYSAAMNLATFIYRDGPRAVMSDERVKDRHIQVCKQFPML